MKSNNDKKKKLIVNEMNDNANIKKLLVLREPKINVGDLFLVKKRKKSKSGNNLDKYWLCCDVSIDDEGNYTYHGFLSDPQANMYIDENLDWLNYVYIDIDREIFIPYKYDHLKSYTTMIKQYKMSLDIKLSNENLETVFINIWKCKYMMYVRETLESLKEADNKSIHLGFVYEFYSDSKKEDIPECEIVFVRQIPNGTLDGFLILPTTADKDSSITNYFSRNIYQLDKVNEIIKNDQFKLVKILSPEAMRYLIDVHASGGNVFLGDDCFISLDYFKENESESANNGTDNN